MPSYKCPECTAKVKSEKEAKPGQKFVCPACDANFVPRAATVAFKDEDDPPRAKVKAKPAAAKPASPPPPPPTQAAKSPFLDDEDDGPKTYGLVKESEEEQRLAEKNKPTFGAVKDKFAKSARGPAAALLVTPVNLLLAQGGLLALAGIATIIVGMWGIVFNGGTPPSDEEFAEGLFWGFMGFVWLLWGSITCFGAVQAVTLGNYPWAVVAGFFGLFPLLAGVFMLLTIWDERVLAGFAEPETGPIQSEAKGEKKDEDEEDEDDDDEDEEDEEEEEEEEKPRKKRR